MKKFILFGLIAFNANFIIAPSVYCSPIQSQNEPREVDSLYHYAFHTLTNAVVGIPMILTAVAGTGLGMVIMENNPNPGGATLAVSSMGAGLLASLYMFYKTPQWTDKNCLGYETERSTKQNVISFLTRAFVPYPFGVWGGEFLAHSKGIAPVN